MLWNSFRKQNTKTTLAHIYDVMILRRFTNTWIDKSEQEANNNQPISKYKPFIKLLDLNFKGIFLFVNKHLIFQVCVSYCRRIRKRLYLYKRVSDNWVKTYDKYFKLARYPSNNLMVLFFSLQSEWKARHYLSILNMFYFWQYTLNYLKYLSHTSVLMLLLFVLS
jgi:hypothetical protein